MKVLLINKFLHPNGGSETYIFMLGEYLQSLGHEVQYFGMEHEKRCVGNHSNTYTKNMDFHSGSILDKLRYSLKTIYSREARKKIRFVLENFQPDVCHLNNFNYQLTPSIILEIVKWRKQKGRKCRIIYTAHDYQLICPNHMLHNLETHSNCEKCLTGGFKHCVKNKCIHGSTLKSLVGMTEATFWKTKKVYRYIDTIICPSSFIKNKLDSDTLLQKKTIVIRNFVRSEHLEEPGNKENYVLYFGRYSKEKGIYTLIEVCRKLPEIPFVFAGSGPLEEEINKIQNIKNVSFQNGDSLKQLIKKARFSIYPSEWYENCPFSIMESQSLGTPVLGSNIGGIPELIQPGQNGELFESGNQVDLQQKIIKMYKELKINGHIKVSNAFHAVSIAEYYEQIKVIYFEGN